MLHHERDIQQGVPFAVVEVAERNPIFLGGYRLRFRAVPARKWII